MHSGDLRQVIAGQDIRCLDDARPGLEERPILISMAHPFIKDQDLVLELVPNEEQSVLEEEPILRDIDVEELKVKRSQVLL